MKYQMLAAYCLSHPNLLRVCNNDSFLFHSPFWTQISKHFPKKGNYNYACVKDGETEALRGKAICPRWQGKLEAESGINPASPAFCLPANHSLACTWWYHPTCKSNSSQKLLWGYYELHPSVKWIQILMGIHLPSLLVMGVTDKQ